MWGRMGLGRGLEEEHFVKLTASNTFCPMSDAPATILTMIAIEPKIRQLLHLLTWYNVFIVVPNFYIVIWLACDLFIDHRRKIPGPFLARITSLWELKKVVHGDLHKTMIKLHERYGKEYNPRNFT